MTPTKNCITTLKTCWPLGLSQN